MRPPCVDMCQKITMWHARPKDHEILRNWMVAGFILASSPTILFMDWMDLQVRDKNPAPWLGGGEQCWKANEDVEDTVLEELVWKLICSCSKMFWQKGLVRSCKIHWKILSWWSCIYLYLVRFSQRSWKHYLGSPDGTDGTILWFFAWTTWDSRSRNLLMKFNGSSFTRQLFVVKFPVSSFSSGYVPISWWWNISQFHVPFAIRLLFSRAAVHI